MNASPVPLGESFDWNGASVRWDRFGDGPPVVLCHGTPWSSFVWRHVIERLRVEHTVFVWDMLGYGQSDKVEADVSLRSQAELLAALVDHWALDAPTVVAHDFGGTVSLRAHLLHRMPASSLALIDVVALRPWGSPFFRLVAGHPDVFAALPPNLHAALVREYIAGASGRGLDVAVLDELVRPWTGDGQAAFYRQIALADERFTAEAEAHYGEITIPTLVVWGTADEWIPVDRAQRLVDAIPGAELRLVDGAGHLIQEDAPDELAEIVATWVARN